MKKNKVKQPEPKLLELDDNISAAPFLSEFKEKSHSHVNSLVNAEEGDLPLFVTLSLFKMVSPPQTSVKIEKTNTPPVGSKN